MLIIDVPELCICVCVSAVLPQGGAGAEPRSQRHTGGNSSRVLSLPGAACLFSVSSVSKRGHQTAKETRPVKSKALWLNAVFRPVAQTFAVFCPFKGILMTCWDQSALNDVLQELHFRDIYASPLSRVTLCKAHWRFGCLQRSSISSFERLKKKKKKKKALTYD